MLHLNDIRNNKEKYIELLKIRGVDFSDIILSVIEKDDERKEIQKELDQILALANQNSKKIGEFFKKGMITEANELKNKSIDLKNKSKQLQNNKNQVEEHIKDMLTQVPNVPHESVPIGSSENDNVIISKGGEIPNLNKSCIPHWDLVEKYSLIDFKLGNKITGSGFPVYKGKGAVLQRALVSYFLNKNVAAGYTEYLPPFMVNETSAFGTGQLPDKEGQMYSVPEDNLYLIPTAEVPVTNFFRDQIISDFPVKCTAYSPCFRREAGSYGQNVRGLNRLHQFEKVEIVQIEHPDHSFDTLNNMVQHVESILIELSLPYRILKLCGKDLGFTSSLTYDFEVYSAAQKKWLEVSSVSNFCSYQANRLKLRFRDENGNTSLCHTLNGSALALPRVYATIIENNQSENEIRIPKVLHPYTGFDVIR